jgi:23S rRNA pseudouridine2605 synthase
MLEAVHFHVARLKRISYGPIELTGLARGKYRHLTADEVNMLRESALQSHNIQKSE